nr:MAG TPA: hypothetical protein [Caudoviricetes sp.]
MQHHQLISQSSVQVHHRWMPSLSLQPTAY